MTEFADGMDPAMETALTTFYDGEVDPEQYVKDMMQVHAMALGGETMPQGNFGVLNTAQVKAAYYAGQVGTVTATGGFGGAGIGGGGSNGGTVTITGGVVTATGGEDAAAIGHGGDSSNDGTLTITDLQVKAGSAATDTIMPNATFLEGFGKYQWVSIGRFHLHTLTGYTLSKTNAKDDTISATCTEDLDNCPLAESEYKATMTITASGEGGGKATLIGNAADFGLTDADIAYTRNGAAITADEITDTGFYTASITAGEKTASITYGVNEVKKDPAFNAADAHGDFTVPAVATADALVTIETTPATGYELKAISVKKADNSAVTSAVNGNSGTFTMPAETVTVSVEFKLHDYTISKSEMTNGSVTAAGTAKMGDTVSLTITPATGYELDTLSVTDSASAALTVTDGAFTMPADDVNVAATFKLHDYTISKSETANGSIAVAGTAKMGDSVEVTVTPDAGYLLDSLTYNDTAITEAEGKYTFTMPAADVAVAAAFAARDVDVTFAAAADEETGSAELLTEEFAPVSESFTRKIGERFVLRVTCAEDCDYVVKFNNDRTLAETSMEEFTAEEYKRYAEFLENHGSSIPTRTDLFWITMPGVAANVDALDITAALAKTKSFTILYKPTTAQEGSVWCKFTDSEGNAFAAEMKNDLNIGGINVWSVCAMSAFVPSGVAFSDSLEALANAAVTDCTGKVNANWSAIAGGEYRVIGGNAKTVAAAFVDESASEKSRDTMTADAIGASAIYEVGVCSTDDLGAVTAPGTVKAPSALSKEGFTFRGWRGFKYDAQGKASEQIYQPGADVPVYGNVTLSAVWSPVILNVAINPNNGTESYNIPTTYGDPVLKPEDIERAGFVLQNWAVGRSVTESGEFLPRGSVFDFSTGITSDLALNASWKHVHCYTCVPLDYPGFNGALDAYSKYFQYLHVKFCACGDVALEAHTYKNGLCTTCGYAKPGAEQVQLEVSHWKQGASSSWMEELPRTAKRGEEVTVSAYWQIGDWQFSKWQYSTDSGATWEDLAADTMVGFLIPCSMKVRAIYVSTIHDPQITLSARNYVTQAQGYNWDTVLFQMEYKLPEGYTLVDAGIRMGDNAGISYYEMKEIKATTGQKAAVIGTKFGMNMIPFVGGGLTGFVTDMTMDAISGDEPQYYYEKRENSVLDEMTAATLSEYMMKSKPVNVEKYPPIYWEAATKTKGRSGSVNTLTPLSFIQKNNGNHYIYGMAYLTYKDSSGKTHTIYTEALPTTRDQIPSYSVKATPNGMTNTQQH